MGELIAFNKMKILSYYQDAKKLKRGEFVIPRMLSVWLSQICNLRCKHCHSADYNKKVNKFIDTKKFIEFISEVTPLGVEGIEFSGGGEPTMHPDFYQIAEFIKFKGLKVGLLTNGTALSDVQRLVKTLSYVRVSLDAVDEDSYNQLKNPVGEKVFDKVKNNIVNLVQARGSNPKPRIGVKFLVTSSNFHDIPKAVNLAIDLKADYVQFKRVHSYGEEITEEEAKESQSSINLCKESDKIVVVGGVEKQLLRERCFMAPIHAVIDSDGNIYVCCFFDENTDLRIGNIFENRFLDVWGSEKHKRLMKNLDIGKCNKLDCRWKFYNNFIGQVIEEDIADISFN